MTNTSPHATVSIFLGVTIVKVMFNSVIAVVRVLRYPSPLFKVQLVDRRELDEEESIKVLKAMFGELCRHADQRGEAIFTMSPFCTDAESAVRGDNPLNDCISSLTLVGCRRTWFPFSRDFI